MNIRSRKKAKRNNHIIKRNSMAINITEQLKKELPSGEIPKQWNHTNKISSVVLKGTRLAGQRTKEISDKMIVVRNGKLIEVDKENGEKVLKQMEYVSVEKSTITLNIKSNK